MSKTIKILAIIDAALVFIWAMLAYATSGADDFSGLVVIYPMIGVAIVTLAIVVLAFVSAAKRALDPPVSQDQRWIGQTIWSIVLLTGIPAVGLFYASLGEGRAGFAALCAVLLVAGVIISLVRIFKSRRA